MAIEQTRTITRQGVNWQITTIKRIKQETPTVKTFTLSLPNWSPHLAGQHYDLRLTAPDGYQAQRSYSIASSPEQMGEIELTVERLPDGEVSGYLHDVITAGDQIEVRGPIGGYFVWQAQRREPLLLVAGGSGIVPLMAMLRHRSSAGSKTPTRLLYSSRTYEDIIYRQALETLGETSFNLEVLHSLTRKQPCNWTGFARRIDLDMLDEVTRPLGKELLAFVCGPTAMVENVANGLVSLGFSPDQIRTERFGPTGLP
jgi:ferredoxin-NADP reductase